MVIICLMMVNNNRVGGIPTPLKNMKVSWDGFSQGFDLGLKII
jgi:hypothetical protein